MNLTELNTLLVRLQNTGLYTGRKQLLQITLEGEFEGFYGRANETWNTRYTVELGEINNIPKITLQGRDLNEVCEKILNHWYEHASKNN